MDSLITALGPAFAAGFAVQRLLEIIDALLSAREARGAARCRLQQSGS